LKDDASRGVGREHAGKRYQHANESCLRHL
jgi:hypothetical protein